MPDYSVFKCEQIRWTRARRWVFFSMLFLVMGTVILFSYISSQNFSWSLNLWTTSPWTNQSLWTISSWSNESLWTISSWSNESLWTISSWSNESLWTISSWSNQSLWTTSSWSNQSHNTAKVDSTADYFVPYPHQYHFIVDEPNRCQQESPFLVLIIPVAPHNKKARDTIRNTWGKEMTVQGQVVSHYFLLGLSKEEDGSQSLQKQVFQESQTHHDIIQSNFLDSYNNLTIKTMVMFEWLDSHCTNTSYAMKVDSDMFLNVPKLVDMLSKAPRRRYMTGDVARNPPVLRDPNSKWFLPVSVFPASRYPSYARGLGYVFSLDLPRKILRASAHVRAVYIEDVYVGMCMRHLGIALTDPPGGLFRSEAPYLISSCYWTSVITTILKNSDQLSDAWVKYQTQARSGC